MDNLKQSHPHEGRTTTKVTYRWMVQSKIISNKEGLRTKSPMGGQSNASHPQVGNLSLPTYKGDKQMNQAIYECLGKKSKSSYLGVCMGGVGSS